MMIILSWNFSPGISFINQKRKPDKKQEKHTQWLKLRIIYRSDCAIGELLWKDIWYHFKGPDTLHGHGLLSTHLRVVCLSQFSSYTHSLITWKKKTNKLKNNTESKFVLKYFDCFYFTRGEAASPLSFLKPTVSEAVGGFRAGMQGWGGWWGTWMLICEVIAFLCRIANSNICQFVKRADSRGHQRHHLLGSRSCSLPLSPTPCPSATMAAKCNMLLLICNNTWQ